MKKKSILCKSLFALGLSLIMASCDSKSAPSPSDSTKESTDLMDMDTVSTDEEDIYADTDDSSTDIAGEAKPTTLGDEVEDKEESKNSAVSLDEALSEYENMVEEYVKFAKKAASGDLSALTSYGSLLEKAESVSEKLEKAKGDMNSKQLKRLLRIQEKMTEAMQIM